MILKMETNQQKVVMKSPLRVQVGCSEVEERRTVCPQRGLFCNQNDLEYNTLGTSDNATKDEDKSTDGNNGEPEASSVPGMRSI